MKFYIWKDARTGYVNLYDANPGADPSFRGTYLGTIEVEEPGKEKPKLPTNLEIDKMLRYEFEASGLHGLEVEAFVEGFNFANGKQLGRPPKKTVTKEAQKNCEIPHGSLSTFQFQVPYDAKNVKCTYEVEE